MNNSNDATSRGLEVAGAASCTLKGATKKSWTLISGALAAGDTSCVVDDATGWRVGDRLVFATTNSWAATSFNVTSSAYSDPYLTCTVSSTTGLVKGARVRMSNMQASLNTYWTIYDVPSSTTFRINVGTGFSLTDGIGNATLQPKIDEVTIATITPGSGTTATITWSGGVGTGGGVAWAHADDCPVGNFTRNVTIGTSNQAYKSFVNYATESGSPTRVARDVCFQNMASGYTTFPSYALRLHGTADQLGGLYNCAFYYNGVASGLYQLQTTTGTFEVSTNVGVGFSDVNTSVAALESAQTILSTVSWTNNCVFGGLVGVTSPNPSDVFSGNQASGCAWGVNIPQNNITYGTYDIWSCGGGMRASSSILSYATFRQSTIGTKFSAACGTAFTASGGPIRATLIDCSVQASNLFSASALDFTRLEIINKNVDPAVQEIYTRHSSTVPAIQRNTGTVSRSTSSIEMTCNATQAITHEFYVLAKAGETINLKVLVRKSGTPAYGASTLPSVTISGLGITPVITTMDAGTAADTWETLTCTATNSGSADGNLTVTLTAQSSTAGAKAFFAGCPVAPFVTRARHYGFLFNETNPVVSPDLVISASEATAAAYTGITITWGASSSTSVTGSNTFQKLYDYHQSQAVLNVGSALALTGAGVAGSPALFAAGNVTVSDGAVLNGSGSISMGAYTLATEFAGGSNYTYTGGTFSQAATVPSFSGGTVTIGAAGTYTFGATDSIIIMTPTAPGTYVLSGGTLSGTIDLRNASGSHAITVELAGGVSYTTANNTGAAITVQTPQIYQSVTISGATSGSRIQIYDTTSSTELYNGTPTFPYTWTDGSPAAADRAIRLRVSYVSGATAKEFIEGSIGTCGQTDETAAISYLVNQTNDTTYNSNAIDGPAIYATSGITFTDASPDRVNCNIAGGSVSYPTIYACFVYWNFTQTGIANDFTYISAPDTANYLLSGMKIRNTSATDLVVTGGYGRDATSGLSADIIDTAGSTGNIFLTPDHVVPYATGSGVTAQDKADIAAQVLTAASSAPIYAEIIKVAGETVTGAGTEGDPWRPV
jgi:hypothetical protein